jgi:hypothetical protein
LALPLVPKDTNSISLLGLIDDDVVAISVKLLSTGGSQEGNTVRGKGVNAVAFDVLSISGKVFAAWFDGIVVIVAIVGMLC